MATPSEKLAASLKSLRNLQKSGATAIRSRQLTRSDRERLLGNGFLKEVIKGWYISARPDEERGESTAWYTSFWGFCAEYLEDRFEDNWSLSPEQSLLLHTGNWTVPKQLLVRSPKAGNKPTQLLHQTSVFDVRASLPPQGQNGRIDGLRVFSLTSTLVQMSHGMFRDNEIEVRTALAMIGDLNELLSVLLEGGHSTIAGRLAGAYRNLGRTHFAEEIMKTMRSAGYTVIETDPFSGDSTIKFDTREESPHVARIKLMWQAMREPIINVFPETKDRSIDVTSYLNALDDVYATDAYHSLSIEGYQVTDELIEKVRNGKWNPDIDWADRDHRNAMAARGYYEAFQAVKTSIQKVLEGANPGVVANQDHSEWFRQLFAPSVLAGILKPADLAGYRNGPVYIRQSKHVPPAKEAVRELMPVFFKLLEKESHPAVRVVLGHFIFVFIHPYFDGNGRMGRFLMNLMMAAGGYPWLVIKVDRRNEYMSALEQASVNKDISAFATFLADIFKK